MSLPQVVYNIRKVFRLKPAAFISVLNNRLRGRWQRIISPKRRVSYGKENPDKVFYIIGVEHKADTGFAWLLFLFFLHIIYAVKKGYIPVIDMQNFESRFLDNKHLHKQNIWEYFFEQPAGINLADIARSKNIILSSSCHFRPDSESIGPYLLDKANNSRLLKLRKLFQQYIHPSEMAQKYFDCEYVALVQNKPKVLGVLCRGTDYLLSKPSGHQIQPDPQIVLQKTKEVMLKKKCSHIYLATEDQDIYDLFKAKFGRKLLANKQRRYSVRTEQKGKLIYQLLPSSTQEKCEMNLAYLSSLYILARCSCFLGGRVGGTIAVYLMTKGFEYEYTWDLGVYS